MNLDCWQLMGALKTENRKMEDQILQKVTKWEMEDRKTVSQHTTAQSHM